MPFCSFKKCNCNGIEGQGARKEVYFRNTM